MSDTAFRFDRDGMLRAVDALETPAAAHVAVSTFGKSLPESGMDEAAVLDLLSPLVIGGAQRLGADTAFAHMDPPTPWITWATAMWNAALNQNLLHPDVAPVARDIEELVLHWLAPVFGMTGGHMTPGSTLSNLTALWAAREMRGIRRVVASRSAHVSVAKAAHLLALDFSAVDTDATGRLALDQLPADLSDAALVLTAGTTNTGSIDPLDCGVNPAWLHVDAAWSGPLRLSTRHKNKLHGIEVADSVSVSAHKWLFQPKESGLVFFRDLEDAHEAVSFSAEYLALPNVGVLGSRGANALPLLATLLNWGRQGLAARIDRAMAAADAVHDFLLEQPSVSLFGPNISGVVLWRSTLVNRTAKIFAMLPPGAASMTEIEGRVWIRHVAANPNVDVKKLQDSIASAVSAGG